MALYDAPKMASARVEDRIARTESGLTTQLNSCSRALEELEAMLALLPRRRWMWLRWLAVRRKP